jgi:PAS domain S-box-containing protein
LNAVAATSDQLIRIALLGEAVDNAPIAVLVFDSDGKYVAVNAEACKLLGYGRDEILSRRLGDLAVDPKHALHEYLAVADGRAAEGTTRIRRGDGTEALVRFRGAATTIAGVAFFVGLAWPA